jgi:signal transduction histidine kinase
MPDVPGDRAMPVRHRQALLGALSITKPRGQSVTGADDKVLADVAGGSGLLLRNIGLNAELLERAEQLRASRRRLVAAHDAERHRLERDLHDGAQQQVVALKVKLGIARTLAEREGAGELAGIVASLADETQAAVDAMRAVAHGIYPPLLEAEGLAAAVKGMARASVNGLTIDTAGLSRLPRPVEETSYFLIMEAVERARMSGAESIGVTIATDSGLLVIDIEHDGTTTRADLTAVVDRVEALGGGISIEAGAGEPTHITSWVPAQGTALELA